MKALRFVPVTIAAVIMIAAGPVCISAIASSASVDHSTTYSLPREVPVVTDDVQLTSCDTALQPKDGYVCESAQDLTPAPTACVVSGIGWVICPVQDFDVKVISLGVDVFRFLSHP